MNSENKLKQIVENTLAEMVSPTFDIISKDNIVILEQIQHILELTIEPARKLNRIIRLIHLYESSIRDVNKRVVSEIKADNIDRFRPILELSICNAGIWRAVLEPMAKDSPGSVFYFDPELRLIPSGSKIDTVYPFMKDTFKELNNSGTTMFNFVRQVFMDSGLVIPPVPKC